MTESDNTFTHLIIGTSLPLSVLSAALSQDSTTKILHIDTEEYYGSHHASLTLSQLLQHIGPSNATFPYFSTSTIPDQLLKLDRHYSLSLCPSLQPASSTSTSLDTLIRSNVAKYATFRLLQTTALYDAGGLTSVPSSKEDIFKSTSLSLIDKRKLMKFLQFAASNYETSDLYTSQAHKPFTTFLAEEFKLSPQLVSAITYGIALSSSEDEKTEQALHRVKSHLTSVGRYGNSAYLVAQYGGVGDIVQGYCRASAVAGSTFILGKKVVEVEKRNGAGVKVKLEGIDEIFSADRVVGSRGVLSGMELEVAPPQPDAGTRTRSLQSLLLLNRSPNLALETETETALVIFPPHSLHASHKYTTTALILGEGTFCCPKGQYVIQCTSIVDDQTNVREVHESIKQKALEMVKDSPVEWTCEGLEEDEDVKPLFEAYWIDEGQVEDDIQVYPPLDQPLREVHTTPHIATICDDSTTQAESLFYALHGVHSPPYPNPRKKSTLRADEEYRGRGGVGPDLDERDQDEDDATTTTQPIFFPVDQDNAAEQDDE